MRYPVYIYPMPEFMREYFYDIYFLLDEFTCYYHTLQMAIELEEYFKNELPQTAENWLSYFGSVLAYYHAYAEFKLFILTYLLVAKEYYPKDYRLIMANKQFKKAFKAVDSNFAALINDFLNRKQKLIIQWLAAQGMKVKETDDSLFIYQGDNSGGAEGRGHLKQGYNIVIKEMEKQKYRDILRELAK